jgi:hypothetical protein
MNTLVDKPQLVRVVIQYLNMKFGNLTPKTSSEFPNSVFYVDSDDEIMMEYDEKKGIVYIHYNHIWLKIRSLFSLEYDDIQSIMKVWLERDYNLRKIKLLEGWTWLGSSWRGLKFK